MSFYRLNIQEWNWYFDQRRGDLLLCIDSDSNSPNKEFKIPAKPGMTLNIEKTGAS